MKLIEFNDQHEILFPLALSRRPINSLPTLSSRKFRFAGKYRQKFSPWKSGNKNYVFPIANVCFIAKHRSPDLEKEKTTKDNNDDDKDIMKCYDKWDYIRLKLVGGITRKV